MVVGPHERISMARGQTLSALMEGEGYEVRCAPSGQTALLFAREEPPELILLDVRLPDVDGFEVCRRLKESAGTCGIPVIFLSALEDAKDKVKGFAVGGADYITKPFHAEEVLARVRTHVALYRLQSDLGRRVEEQTATLRVANTQLAQNIEALNRSEEALKERLRFETLLTFFIYFAPGATYAPHQLPKPLSPSTRASSTNFNDAQAKGRHLTQYFEIFGNRTIYHDGWLAGTVHGAAWEYKPRASLENDTWELYDARTDFAPVSD
jgi:DNA-binding response OmpR family regulator